MTYLLDTNACIALINGEPLAVRDHFQRVLDDGGQLLVSTVVAFELWYGVGKSSRQQLNTIRIERFFSGPVRLLSFDEEDAKSAGHLRAALEDVGRPIGASDVLVAGQALRHGLTLVTANAKEFRRVKGLLWEDWAKH